jgi:cysteine desulfurase
MIYLDHAATTPLDPTVLKAMEPYLTEQFGNPSQLYSLGRKARDAVEQARETIAGILNCTPSEIIFTSGGTESCNSAIFGIVTGTMRPHIITTPIEHSSILEPLKKLEKEAYQIDYLNVNEFGEVNLDHLSELIDPTRTAMVSVIYGNNEIGTTQNISSIAQICKEANIPLHTDACQAPGLLNIDVQELGVDAMSLNASKIYGPKGIGLLYLKEGTPFEPQILGGGQENNQRSGTENVAAIVGFAKALELAAQSTHKNKIAGLRDHAIKRLTTEIEGCTLNGHPLKRLAGNINISIDGIEGESILLRLDQKDIYVSTGSACASQSASPSHVLDAIGKTKNEAHSSLRITLGRSTTLEEIDQAIEVVKETVEEIRIII